MPTTQQPAVYWSIFKANNPATFSVGTLLFSQANDTATFYLSAPFKSSNTATFSSLACFFNTINTATFSLLAYFFQFQQQLCKLLFIGMVLVSMLLTPQHFLCRLVSFCQGQQ